MHIHLDFETFSTCDIRKAGAYRYAADPSTEILIAHVKRSDGIEGTWIPRDFLKEHGTQEEKQSKERAYTLLWEASKDPGTLIYAFNSQFEYAICKYCLQSQLGISPPRLEQFRCTAAMGRRANMPPTLDRVGEALELNTRKDKDGKRLIRIFSIPRRPTIRDKSTRVLPQHKPDEFRNFVNYCIQDVHTEEEVKEKLISFEMAGDTLETFLADAKLNEEGIPVNVQALENASKIVEEAAAEVLARYRQITGLSPTQIAKSLEWFKKHGYPADNLQTLTVKDNPAEDWTKDAEVIEAFKLKAESSFAALKKVDAMLNCHIDGKIHGGHLYYGAQQTGRWSGRLAQPQNFKRPTFKDTDTAYQMIKEGCSTEDLTLLFGNPLEAVSSCIRHFIEPQEGKFLDADYSAIEARIVCWLAGQEDALERFRNGVDSYKDMASVIFDKPVESIDSIERWVGKQTVLGCGYQMGAGRFLEQCETLAKIFDMDSVVTPELAERSVTAFRQKYNKVVNFWYQSEEMAKKAVLEPGKFFPVGKLKFGSTVSKGAHYLVLKLPSGRNIVYPRPVLKQHPKFEKLAIQFYGQIPFKVAYGMVSTYGGKLVENATQGVAADIMANGLVTAQKQGFRVVALIHDEALAHQDDKTIEDFCNALTTLPPWAEGLPVEAEGEIVPYYKK